MKPSEIIEAIERLFLDIIAYVVPGASLILCVIFLLFSTQGLSSSATYVGNNAYLIWFFLFAAYVVGQALETFGNLVTEKVAVRLTRAKFLLAPKRMKLSQNFMSLSDLERRITESDIFAGAVRKLQANDPTTLGIRKDDLRSWRNLALSDGSAEQKHLVYRFMFISILSLGMATVCFILVVSLLATVILHTVEVRPMFPQIDRVHLEAMTISLLLGYFFLRRRADFYARSMRVPFSMVRSAAANIQLGFDKDVSPKQPRRLKVYMAGGFHSGWQAEAMSKLSEFSFFDPRGHQLKNAQQYTEWDLGAIKQSDWVLAYLEKDNPGGYALSLELGFAKALSKKIVLINEKADDGSLDQRHFAMLHACADVSVPSLEEAIRFLNQIGQVQ